ncbi:vicilin-like seed storage protein [Cucumis melo var. makuwa]|uniref:Vicilin-like seed storage protein n=1 Tax=Cucumis melo var. makuwa TaxID=1194695 RepID=A0A5A7V1G4_CUCMM|nr:vicilin-like seed storage protein [Cucumis melo var. makuwa]
MARDRNGELTTKRGSSDDDEPGEREGEDNSAPSKRISGKDSEKDRENSCSDADEGRKRTKSRRKSRENSDSDEKHGKRRGRSSRRKGKSRRRYSSSEEDSDSEDTESDSSMYDSESGNKRPEFTAWLAEIKKVNLESLANWEEKQMFKEFMEDHNTATFPSKKYYNLDAYYQRKIQKDMKKGHKKVVAGERTVFDDEEQRRQELLIEREKHKEEQVEALKRSMQTGMAQAMKEQARLREEMAYQYKLGNFEAAAAIQRRLDPDVAL